MFASWKDNARWLPTAVLALGAMGLLLAMDLAWAGQPWWGVPSGWEAPWQRRGYQGYAEPARPATPPPPVVTAVPQKYTLTITILPQRMPAENPSIVGLMAHVPEHARIWFQGQPTT